MSVLLLLCEPVKVAIEARGLSIVCDEEHPVSCKVVHDGDVFVTPLEGRLIDSEFAHGFESPTLQSTLDGPGLHPRDLVPGQTSQATDR